MLHEEGKLSSDTNKKTEELEAHVAVHVHQTARVDAVALSEDTDPDD